MATGCDARLRHGLGGVVQQRRQCGHRAGGRTGGDVQVPNPDQSDPDTPYVNDGLYFIYYGEGAQAVAEAIFGPSLRPGVTYSKEHLSRKQIVPKIMEILQ